MLRFWRIGVEVHYALQIPGVAAHASRAKLSPAEIVFNCHRPMADQRTGRVDYFHCKKRVSDPHKTVATPPFDVSKGRSRRLRRRRAAPVAALLDCILQMTFTPRRT